MDNNLIIIDNNLKVSINRSDYGNEINTLTQLRYGLLGLFKNVRKVELDIVKISGPNCQRSFVGKPAFISDEVYYSIPCFFHWFAISICNYVRLVGFIVSKENGDILENDLQTYPQKVKIACDQYCDSINEIKEVLTWRNKVSAHFAITYPKKDNIATLKASVMDQIGFEHDRYRTNLFIYSLSDPKNKYDSNLPSWSLTEVFENLKERYWFDLKIGND